MTNYDPDKNVGLKHITFERYFSERHNIFVIGSTVRKLWTIIAHAFPENGPKNIADLSTHTIIIVASQRATEIIILWTIIM